jgi:PhnB protein
MTSRLNPYISFDDTARAALEFYAEVFGGTPTISTFGETGMPGPDGDKVMHGMLETTAGFTLMCADTPTGMTRSDGARIAISLSGDDVEDLRAWWAALSEGGDVTMPLDKQVWGDEFGMCTDRYGVPWMVNISQPG